MAASATTATSMAAATMAFAHDEFATFMFPHVFVDGHGFTDLMGVNPSVSEQYYPNMEIKSEVADVNMEAHSVETTSAPPVEPKPPVKVDGRKTRRKGTNLYGRPYCPGRPLSMEERTRIIELHMNGMKVNAISKALCISHGCVSKIISRYRSTGVLTPASSPEQRRTKRIKKSASPPVQMHDYSSDYCTQLAYPNTPQSVAPLPLEYTTQTLYHPNSMMMHDYHQPVLL